MIKKTKSTIFFLIIILIFSTLTATAYYQPAEYRKSLLEIRDVERELNSLNQKIKQAEASFRIIAGQNIESQLQNSNQLYQAQIKAYQNKNEKKVKQLAVKIINDLEKLSLKLVESKPVQLRGFWLDSGTFADLENRAGVKKLLDQAQKANFNVIFPEIFYKGLTVIPTNNLFKQDPRFADWEQDPLKILIEEAQKRNIEIHGWLWVFNENTKGQKGRILTKHPEWANKNKAGKIVSYHNSTWLSPSHPDVKKYLQQRFQYLVKNYDLAGVNFDYIRFPEEYRGSFGYDKNTVARFKKEYGLDPFQIESGSDQLAVWNNYREKLITEMIKESSEQLRNLDSDLLISADVIPGRNEARYRALQNWFYWLKAGIIDFAVPMTYTENLFSELSNWIEKDRELVESAIYPGVSVFKLSSDQLLEQVAEINQINPNGMSLFAAAHLTKNNYNSLAEGAFSKKAVLPYQNKRRSLVVIQKFILKRLKIIQAAEKIENKNLIKIRSYLHKYVNDQLEKEISFEEFMAEAKIELSEEVAEALKADFDYLEDIKKLY